VLAGATALRWSFGMDISKGVGIALAASALLAATGCGSADEEQPGSQSARIMCEGGNSCMGHSECATAEGASSCKGTNGCKGTGWVYADSEEECAMLQEANKAS
jgi:hypothetical protein